MEMQQKNTTGHGKGKEKKEHDIRQLSRVFENTGKKKEEKMQEKTRTQEQHDKGPLKSQAYMHLRDKGEKPQKTR